MPKLDDVSESLALIMSIMKENNIAKLHYSEGVDLQMEAQGNGTTSVSVTPEATSLTDIKQYPKEKPLTATDSITIKSPIVGTFYGSPAPDKPAFVSVGQKVTVGDIIYIVESMKVMNEIKSESDGVVAEILVKDGDTVEFDQPLMRFTV